MWDRKRHRVVYGDKQERYKSFLVEQDGMLVKKSTMDRHNQNVIRS